MPIKGSLTGWNSELASSITGYRLIPMVRFWLKVKGPALALCFNSSPLMLFPLVMLGKAPAKIYAARPAVWFLNITLRQVCKRRQWGDVFPRVQQRVWAANYTKFCTTLTPCITCRGAIFQRNWRNPARWHGEPCICALVLQIKMTTRTKTKSRDSGAYFFWLGIAVGRARWCECIRARCNWKPQRGTGIGYLARTTHVSIGGLKAALVKWTFWGWGWGGLLH